MTTDFDLRDENWYLKWAEDHTPALARVIRRQKERIEKLERVAEASNVWRTHHVCCPKDCPDLHTAQKNLGDAIDALAALEKI